MNEESTERDASVKGSAVKRALLGGLVALAVAAVGVGGYFIGESGGEDLDAARVAGQAEGQAAGAAEGAEAGYAAGFEKGRSKGFDRSYRQAFDAAYREAFTRADLPEPKKVPVPEP